jgi:ferrous iron transport protein B
MKLSELQEKEKGIILKVKGRGAFRRRILEMGFVSGKEIQVVKRAPLKDPIEYSIMGYNLSLRESEAELIEVLPFSADVHFDQREYSGTIDDSVLKTRAAGSISKVINIVLVGNPNSGKTTLFNYASGSHERVGNYSGVTVDAKEAQFRHKAYTFNIVDLPGTYSVSAYSPEEIYVRSYIQEHLPDVVVNVVDASNLERNMFLTTQLIDMDIKVVMALNMYDDLQKRGDKLDHVALGTLLGIPVAPTVSSKRKGVSELFDKIIEVFEDKDPTVRHIHINYGTFIEPAIKAIQKKIREEVNYKLTIRISSRYLAIKLLEKDKESFRLAESCVNGSEIIDTAIKEAEILERSLKESTETLITDARYGFVSGALKETMTPGKISERRNSDAIDDALTHKVFGLPIFIAIMWLVFMATFRVGAYPSFWIETGVAHLNEFVKNILDDGMLKDLLTDGIISGVGGVIVFLPNILLLFFFISLMEDTGYMARAVFIMDKLMHKIGLHGKSFIPMIMGFGCNVPAIMATRTIENRNERLLTILINPFMSCSARLPVYILLISAFFPHNAGSMLFIVYFTGVVIAIVAALILKKVLFKKAEYPFVMELPPYRVPTTRSLLKHMWHKGEQYLQKVGGVILIASVIIWALGYFPTNKEKESALKTKISNTENFYSQLLIAHSAKNEIKTISFQKDSTVNSLVGQYKRDKQENSYIGEIGKAIEPIIKPAGFDWRMGISILTGIAAKEIVVGTMAVLYQSEDNPDNPRKSLGTKLKSQVYASGDKAGENVFTPLIAFSFMIFILLYAPCIGTLSVIARETGSVKWSFFVLTYTTFIAWLMAVIIYQGGSLLGL